MARVCTAIAENPADARRLTIKRNTVAAGLCERVPDPGAAGAVEAAHG